MAAVFGAAPDVECGISSAKAAGGSPIHALQRSSSPPLTETRVPYGRRDTLPAETFRIMPDKSLPTSARSATDKTSPPMRRDSAILCRRRPVNYPPVASCRGAGRGGAVTREDAPVVCRVPETAARNRGPGTASQKPGTRDRTSTGPVARLRGGPRCGPCRQEGGGARKTAFCSSSPIPLLVNSSLRRRRVTHCSHGSSFAWRQGM